MTSLQQVIRGRVWKFGDSVDTTSLASHGVTGSTPEETLRLNCLRGIRPEFTNNVKDGDIVVAGSNFGCGSSKQMAVQALQLCGIAAVLVESVARIYRRNAIALALPLFVIPDITLVIEDGDEIEIDYVAGSMRNPGRGTERPLPRYPAGVEEIIEAGGIVPVLAHYLADQGIVASAQSHG